jgi:hypothetical protein
MELPDEPPAAVLPKARPAAPGAERAAVAVAPKGPAAPKPPETPTAAVAPKAESAATAARRPEVPKAAAGTAFDRAAAAQSLAAAAAQASTSCKKPGDPSGIASVAVTFAPSGRVTSATVSGPPFSGTATGGCIASTLRRAQIPAFDGDKVTVGKTIVIR